MRNVWARRRGFAPLVAGGLVGGFAWACTDERPTLPVVPLSEAVREFTGPSACHVDATETTYGTDSSKVLVTFEGGWENCYPALATYGIDMADPLGVDTPQATVRWQIAPSDAIVNAPSGNGAAYTQYVPDIAFIEFDPPVQSVEFYYSRLTPSPARWGGNWLSTDSMRVYAMSRTPGTVSYTTYDTEVLYSNVPSATAPWTAWDYARLEAAGDQIQWLWFDGDAVLDELTITRRTVPDTGFSVSVQCSPSPVVRGSTLTCDASWAPTSIQASEIDFAWRFQGDSILVFPDPAYAFSPPPQIDSSGTAMSSWSGLAVHSGSVTVTGTWQASSDSGSYDVLVSQRSPGVWGDLPVAIFPDTGDIVPNFSQPLAVAGQNADSSGNADWSKLIEGEPSVARIPAGPNAGLWYNTAPGVESRRRIFMNVWLTGRENPAWIIYSCPTTDTLTHRQFMALRRNNTNCKGPYTHRNDSTELRDGVFAHEAYGQNGGKGHQGQIELAAQSLPTCGKVPSILERAVGDSSSLAFYNAAVVTEGAKSLAAASWHDHVYGNYSNAPFYQLINGFTSAGAMNLVTALGDMQDTAQAATASNWGCTRVY